MRQINERRGESIESDPAWRPGDSKRERKELKQMCKLKAMRLVDPSTGLMECIVCGTRRQAKIQPDGNIRSEDWDCPNGCDPTLNCAVDTWEPGEYFEPHCEGPPRPSKLTEEDFDPDNEPWDDDWDLAGDP